MDAIIVNKNYEKAAEILSGKILFNELIELAPGQYPKGAVKKAEEEDWSLWVKNDLNYVVILGVGVFQVI